MQKYASASHTKDVAIRQHLQHCIWNDRPGIRNLLWHHHHSAGKYCQQTSRALEQDCFRLDAIWWDSNVYATSLNCESFQVLLLGYVEK
jgi:hypothetical protein